MSDRAFDLLTDLTLTPQEAVRRFAKLSRRWTPINQGFVLHVGAVLRTAKQERVFEEHRVDQWCDDGGRA
jgi:hypothetical protein